jgi:hypothetical protein
VIRAPVVSIGGEWAEIREADPVGLPAGAGMRWQLNGWQASPILSAAPARAVRAVLIEPEISTTSVVLVGSLNPTIFTPDWFARHRLLSDKEAESARVDIIHSQIAKFAIDWLSLEVQPGRIQALTTQAPSIRIRDLMLRTFKEFLPHTPLNKLGINRQVHFKLGTVELRHSIGYKLAPPEAWGEWAPQIKAGKGGSRGGMTSVGMRQAEVDDGRPAGFIQAKVEPSTKIPGYVGVFMEVNDPV